MHDRGPLRTVLAIDDVIGMLEDHPNNTADGAYPIIYTSGAVRDTNMVTIRWDALAVPRCLVSSQVRSQMA